MNALPLTKIFVSVFGLLLIVGTNVATANPKPVVSNSYDCFTDDGYGRKRPCSAGYKAKHKK